MSAKPPKKSDLSKEWMQPRRDKKVAILPEYHLIVSEGIKTEPQYFEGLKREISLKYNKQGKGRIEIQIEGEGDNTLTLLERAREHVKRNVNPIRHVWLVYDKDSFPPDNFDNTAFKCQSLSDEDGQGTCYHALWSNQCIELWFLLHFDYLQSDIYRTEYKPKLDEHLVLLDKGVYEKNRDDIYEILRPNLSAAIANAKRLKEYHNDMAPSRNAPGTTVFEIFELLLPYL